MKKSRRVQGYSTWEATGLQSHCYDKQMHSCRSVLDKKIVTTRTSL